MNGFDGKQEVGGIVDRLGLKSKTWSSFDFSADGSDGPCARSVGSLLALHVCGRMMLVTMSGERDPSFAGHAGDAGRCMGL